MIKERKPLALYEVKELADSLKETDKLTEISTFIKKYSKLNAEKSKKLKKELEGLNLMKLRQADIIKIVDLVPDNAAELNKIMSESSLDTDETNKILETIKNIK